MWKQWNMILTSYGNPALGPGVHSHISLAFALHNAISALFPKAPLKTYKPPFGTIAHPPHFTELYIWTSF